MTTLADLYSFEKNATVDEVLSAYFECDSNKLMHTIAEDELDTIKCWAEDTGISVADLIDWIDASLRYPAKFRIIKESNAFGLPWCSLDLDAGIVLQMDWEVE